MDKGLVRTVFDLKIGTTVFRTGRSDDGVLSYYVNCKQVTTNEYLQNISRLTGRST